MKTVLALLSTLLLSTAVYVSLPVATPKPEISGSGICVVEFNASFNSQNGVSWIENISDCKPRRIDIVSQPDLQKEYNITSCIAIGAVLRCCVKSSAGFVFKYK